MNQYTKLEIIEEDQQLQSVQPPGENYLLVNNIPAAINSDKQYLKQQTKYQTESFACGRYQGMLQGLADDIF